MCRRRRTLLLSRSSRRTTSGGHGAGRCSSARPRAACISSVSAATRHLTLGEGYPGRDGVVRCSTMRCQRRRRMASCRRRAPPLRVCVGRGGRRKERRYGNFNSDPPIRYCLFRLKFCKFTTRTRVETGSDSFRPSELFSRFG